MVNFFKSKSDIKTNNSIQEVSTFLINAFMYKHWEFPNIDYLYRTDKNQVNLLTKEYKSQTELSDVLNTYIPLIFKARSKTFRRETLEYFFPDVFESLYFERNLDKRREDERLYARLIAECKEKARKKLTEKYLHLCVRDNRNPGFIHAVIAILQLEIILVGTIHTKNLELIKLMEASLLNRHDKLSIDLIYGTHDWERWGLSPLRDGAAHALKRIRRFYR